MREWDARVINLYVALEPSRKERERERREKDGEGRKEGRGRKEGGREMKQKKCHSLETCSAQSEDAPTPISYWEPQKESLKVHFTRDLTLFPCECIHIFSLNTTPWVTSTPLLSIHGEVGFVCSPI